MSSKDNSIVSSHRDAATRISTYLQEAQGVTLKPIAALEVLARALGVANWQTLKALADQGRTSVRQSTELVTGRMSGPGAQMETREKLWLDLVTRSVERRPVITGNVEQAIDCAQEEMDLVLSQKQRAAVRQALHSPVSIISGYADSGNPIIAEALVRAAVRAGLKNVINARRGDIVQVRGDDVNVPEYRTAKVGNMVTPLSVERLGPLLSECELLIVDQHVACEKYLFWDVVQATPATCRVVVLGEIQMNDGSTMGDMLHKLVQDNHVGFAQLHEALGQQQVRIDTMVAAVKRGSSQARQDKGSGRAGKLLPAVRPSQAWNVPAFVYSPDSVGFTSTTRTGKWCIICDAETVDALWEKVCQAIQANQLRSALASSPNNARAHGGTYVICVFTPSWEDEADVMRARAVLRELGVTQKIGYKRDIETFNGVYGTPDEWYYQA